VRCHKLLLSLVSPTFKDKFFGPSRRKNRNTSGLCDVIEETEFSYEVFHMFVRFLYGDKHIIHRSQDFQQLFELLHMAKTHQMSRLVEIVLQRIVHVEVTMETVLSSLEIARHYRNIIGLQDISESLTQKVISAASSISNKELHEFYSQHRADKPDMVFHLINLMPKIKNPVKHQFRLKCVNCKMPKDQCKDGQRINVVPHPWMRIRDKAGNICSVDSITETKHRTDWGEQIYNVRLRWKDGDVRSWHYPAYFRKDDCYHCKENPLVSRSLIQPAKIKDKLQSRESMLFFEPNKLI